MSAAALLIMDTGKKLLTACPSVPTTIPSAGRTELIDCSNNRFFLIKDSAISLAFLLNKLFLHLMNFPIATAAFSRTDGMQSINWRSNNFTKLFIFKSTHMSGKDTTTAPIAQQAASLTGHLSSVSLHPSSCTISGMFGSITDFSNLLAISPYFPLLSHLFQMNSNGECIKMRVPWRDMRLRRPYDWWTFGSCGCNKPQLPHSAPPAAACRQT